VSYRLKLLPDHAADGLDPDGFNDDDEGEEAYPEPPASEDEGTTEWSSEGDPEEASRVAAIIQACRGQIIPMTLEESVPPAR
jgi:hypothetical protein